MKRRDFIKSVVTLASLAPIATNKAIAGLSEENNNSERKNKMKVIVLNGSPRTNFNTAQLLKQAQKGAESVGAEVEYYDLVKINYKGCMSCFACKLKGSKTNGLCAIRDDLRPILEKVLQADAVIIGTPVYFSYATGMFRNLIERMLFAPLRYMKDEKTCLKRKIPVGLVFTMNCPENLAQQIGYDKTLGSDENAFRRIFGHCEVLNSYDTYQFTDYSKYDCDMFDEAHKKQVHETQFPKDLEKAFDLGKRLATLKLD